METNQLKQAIRAIDLLDLELDEVMDRDTSESVLSAVSWDWLDAELEDVPTQDGCEPSTPAVLSSLLLPSCRDRRVQERRIRLLACIGVGLGAAALSLAEIDSTRALPVEIMWQWRSLHDATVRSAYQKGECSRKSDIYKRRACFETQLHQYRPAENGN